MEEHNSFTNEDHKKYLNYLITSQQHNSPPYEWSQNIFQRYKPISGSFPVGNNYYGNLTCVNNQTGRGYYANPCGYWDKSGEQFNSGNVKKEQMNGVLFPIDKNGDNVMTTPNDQVVFGYARIGEEYRSR
jgi:hypothetical protein